MLNCDGWLRGVPPFTCITIGLCREIGNSIISVMVYISTRRVWVGIVSRSVSACGTSSNNKIVVTPESVSVWLILLSIFLSYLPMCHQTFISQCHFCIIFLFLSYTVYISPSAYFLSNAVYLKPLCLPVQFLTHDVDDMMMNWFLVDNIPPFIIMTFSLQLLLFVTTVSPSGL